MGVERLPSFFRSENICQCEIHCTGGFEMKDVIYEFLERLAVKTGYRYKEVGLMIYELTEGRRYGKDSLEVYSVDPETRGREIVDEIFKEMVANSRS